MCKVWTVDRLWTKNLTQRLFLSVGKLAEHIGRHYVQRQAAQIWGGKNQYENDCLNYCVWN